MPEVSAAAVKALRERTGLPLMKCKEALQKTGGDEQAAIEELRKEGAKTMAIKAGERTTAFGRFGIYADTAAKSGAMVELLCESAPVAANEEFVQLSNDLAKALATGPGAKTPDELLAQQSPSKKGSTLKQQLEDLYGRMREVFKVNRMIRFDGPSGGYSHNSGKVLGALVQVEGGNNEAAKNVAMHVAAKTPLVLTVEELDPALVAKEREILTEASRKEGKPENIIAKMVEGRMRQFYGEHVLLEQPYVREEKQTVGNFAKGEKMKIVRFQLWEMGKE
jgi:elongation factor Ts